MGAILIFSKMGEASTCEVIDWLDSYQTHFFRINDGEIHKLPTSIQLGNDHISLGLEKNNTSINEEDITAVWFRKTKTQEPPNLNGIEDLQIKRDIENHTLHELEAYNFAFYHLLEKKWLNHPSKKEINKPYQLHTAQKLGFKVPPTLVTNDKNKLLDFKKTHPNLIVKAVFRSRGFVIDKVFYAGFTAVLTTEIIDSLPSSFFPMLVQEKIDKEYEIRTFYIDGECHSMAIFSQLDQQTALDYRRYNRTNPNRTVPYSLPKQITERIQKLMAILELNSGSLDFIRAKDGNYYFLEVNPNGQFGMVSKPCNYYLEKKIAAWLIQQK